MLRQIFGDRLISRFANREWPSRSPDLNPLDFSFWNLAMTEVYKVKPKTLEELTTTVENFFEQLGQDENLVRKIVGNILKRAEICVQQEGGHFEHLIK